MEYVGPVSYSGLRNRNDDCRYELYFQRVYVSRGHSGHLVSGLWSLVSGLWSLESGLWSLVSGYFAKRHQSNFQIRLVQYSVWDSEVHIIVGLCLWKTVQF